MSRKMSLVMKRKRIISIVAIAVVMFTVVVSATSILKRSDNRVVVTIRGNVKNVTYNGHLQSSIGYTVETNSKDYTTDDFVCYATDSVSATNAGTYAMGISSAEFCNINPDFKDVVFIVVDGSLSISEEPSADEQ
jgi:hypothetical protein